MTRSTKIRLLAAVALTMGLLAPLLGPVATPASAVADVQTQRLGGADRFATAAEVAREGHPAADTALIANGMNFPDALAGATLAGAVNAPILLVTPTSIPAATASALSDIGVNDVVILGGPNAVSPQVEAQLRQNYGVTRVEGADRYQTAVAIARRAAVGGIGTVDDLRTAFISTGLNFPDALGAGPLAYEGNLPSFLTRTNELPAEVAQAIRDLNIEHVVILGGTQAVSASVESQIEATGASTERLNGRNRAETATFVADFALARMGFEGVNVILARGDNFPDALAGGPLGGERRAVILLTATPCQLAIETRLWLEEHFGTVARIFVLGGPNAVCDAVVREAEAAAETNNLPPSGVALTISGGSTDGGPKWQYQQAGASPSKTLTLSAFVFSLPEDAETEADRIPAAREDVIFNVRPTTGDDPANNELNLTARTDSNGVARVTYTRPEAGTDTITVRLRDDTSISDDGVGRWDASAAPILLTPNEPATIPAGQEREFVVVVDEVNPEGVEVNLTTLELVDEDPGNDTNVGALEFGGGSDEVIVDTPAGPVSDDPTPISDDRADSDETFAKVVTRTSPEQESEQGIFTITSNASQVFTLMAFIDTVAAPAANDDNTNPPEYRDIAGVTAFVAGGSFVSIAPPADSDVIARRSGQQIVYTVTAVDPQGEPYAGRVDVSFLQLTDSSPGTTTTAEFDWFDNSETPSNQEGSENSVPAGATATAAGTTRIEVTPNSEGVFTFAITHPQQSRASTSGNPIAWLDLPGGTNNRPDSAEPRAVGAEFEFSVGSLVTATLESLGCPPGTMQRGHPGFVADGGEPGNNPLTSQDPCLGQDVLASDPHVPWELDLAPVSQTEDAATSETPEDDVEGTPAMGENEATISRGDIVFRFTYRDPAGTIFDDTATVRFRITHDGLTSFAFDTEISAAPNRPNPGSAIARPVPPDPGFLIIEVPATNGIAEIVVDSDSARNVTVTAELEAGTSTGPLGLIPFTCITADDAQDFCEDTAAWTLIDVDTTEELDAAITPGQRSPQANCPATGVLAPPCFNGNVVAIDKARDSYVMNTGGFSGGRAYVVYAAGGGGEVYGADRTGACSPNCFQGERKITANEVANNRGDEYFIDGLPAVPDDEDNERCGVTRLGGTPTAQFANVLQPGCARFDAAMTFDDRMVYEFAGAPPSRTQTHFLTNGDAPIGD